MFNNLKANSAMASSSRFRLQIRCGPWTFIYGYDLNQKFLNYKESWRHAAAQIASQRSKPELFCGTPGIYVDVGAADGQWPTSFPGSFEVKSAVTIDARETACIEFEALKQQQRPGRFLRGYNLR